jgi:hypothetical protein
MKKIVFILGFASSLLKAQVANIPLAKSIIEQLERQRFDSVYATFDTTLTNKISAEMLEQMWSGFSRFMGDYKRYSDLRCEETKNKDSSIVALCEFEKSKLSLFLHFTPERKLNGIYFRQPKSTKAYSSPEYFNPSKFYENKVIVKTKQYSLPGILTVPNNITNPPVIILLSGSGPNDKDESVGPNKPLKDLACGLAANGVACLRYDKRTLAYGQDFSDNKTKLTLNEEYIADAFSAVKAIKENEATKNSKIFILGHSLGAGCVASVAAKEKAIHGVILMAGTARHLEDVVLEQYQYILGLDGLNKEDSLTLNELKMQVATVKNAKLLKKASANDLPLGMTSEYWQSINQIVTTQSVANLKQPVLVM